MVMVTLMDSRIIAAIRITCTDLWHWLGDYGIPRSKIDRKPMKFLFDLHKQRSFRSSEQKSKLNHTIRVLVADSIPSCKPVYSPITP